MAKRSNHYDVAFARFLQSERRPYVSVDERRRARLAQASLKSMDFIVYSRRPQHLLVDVKGRRFPSGGEGGGHKWENWVTEDDLVSLLEWQQVFGTAFRAAIVFAYHLVEPEWRSEFDNCFEFGRRTYAFYGVWVDEYRAAMRTRSPSWQTVNLPSRVFRSLRAPLRDFL